MAVKAVLCGNTYESRFYIKDKGFVWDTRRHNWTNRYTNVAPAVDAIEGIEGLTGVRATIFDGTSCRLLWWRDFGVYVPELSDRNEGRYSVRRQRDRQQNQPTEPVINSTSDLDALSEYMNSRGYTSTEGFRADDGMAGEVVVTIPRWLAIDRGCAKKLRGHLVATERRQVEIRGAVRTVWCYRFIGHNEIGNTETCHRCGRRLTHPVSRVVGYGPECCSRLGISRRVDMNDINNVETMTQLILSQNVDVWLPMSHLHYVML